MILVHKWGWVRSEGVLAGIQKGLLDNTSIPVEKPLDACYDRAGMTITTFHTSHPSSR